MNSKDTIKQCLYGFPQMWDNQWMILEYLFCTNGNGYHWEKGEIIDSYKSKRISEKKAIRSVEAKRIAEIEDFHIKNKIMNSELLEKGYVNAAYLEENKDYRSDDEIYAERLTRYNEMEDDMFKEMFKDNIYKPIKRNSDGSIKTYTELRVDEINERYDKYIYNIKNIQEILNTMPYDIYVDSLYDSSLIMNIPEDVTDDWLEKAKDFYNYLMDNPESMSVGIKEYLQTIKFPR